MADAAAPTAISRLRDIPATLFVLGLCLAWWIRCEWAGDTTKVDDLVAFGALERSRAWSGEPWRLVSAMFLHIGALHLVWNVWGMYSLCGAVERWIGSWRFLVAYFLSGLLGSASSLAMHDVVGAGASGAAFGMIGVVLVAHYHVQGSWRAFFASSAVKGILVNIAIWTALGMTALRMDNWAHGGGLLGGILAGIPLLAWRQRRPRVQAAGVAVVALLVAAACFVAVRPAPGATALYGAHRAFQDGVAKFESDPAGALRDFERAEALGDSTPENPFNRGLLRGVLGDEAGARREFERARDRSAPGSELRAKAEERLRGP